MNPLIPIDKKRVLSFDIGIKNLAYCVLEKNISSDIEAEKFKILDWGIINLSNDLEKCDFIIRNGSKCDSVARTKIYHLGKVELFGNKLSQNSCQTHYVKMIPTVSNILSGDKKCYLCSNSASVVLSRTSYGWCDEHYNSKGIAFVKKIKTKKIFVRNANKEAISELLIKMYNNFNTHTNFLLVDEVLIENQPSLKNPTMKTISGIVYSYFMMKGIIEKSVSGSSIQNVLFISPSNKLKVNETLTDEIIGKSSTSGKTEQNTPIDNQIKIQDKHTYKLTKTLGIKYCQSIISSAENDILIKYKKKDDMCDAFLQAFQYMFRPVPNHYVKLLASVGFETDKKN